MKINSNLSLWERPKHRFTLPLWYIFPFLCPNDKRFTIALCVLMVDFWNWKLRKFYCHNISLSLVIILKAPPKIELFFSIILDNCRCSLLIIVQRKMWCENCIEENTPMPLDCNVSFTLLFFNRIGHMQYFFLQFQRISYLIFYFDPIYHVLMYGCLVNRFY